MKVLLVLTTVPPKAAKRVADLLLRKKLVACVSILSAKSFFLWKGKRTTAAERLLLIKTTPGLRGQLLKELLGAHPYEVPELLFLTVEASENYNRWVLSETKKV